MHSWVSGMDGVGGSILVSGMHALRALAAVTMIWAVRSAGRPTAMEGRTQQPGSAFAAQQILSSRWERGEIDPNKFRTMIAVLSRGRSS